MTLRDYFAATAAAAYVANPVAGVPDVRLAADYGYKLADALLARRAG
jgi:hypothetical protein